jgi:hypothetical protein
MDELPRILRRSRSGSNEQLRQTMSDYANDKATMIKSLFEQQQMVAEYVEQALRKEECACDPSDARQLADIVYRRRRSAALSNRWRSLISMIEKEPGQYLTADAVALDLEQWRVPPDAWRKAYARFQDVEIIKQDLEFWKELAREAIGKAMDAGADLSALRTAYPWQMAELDADAKQPPF